MKNNDKVIDWDTFRMDTQNKAKAFMNTNEDERFWYIGGDIVEAAVICDAWGENIHKVAKWLEINGKGMQPTLATFLIDSNI